ncbi:MAG: AsmA family protein, partial [Hyphomicrobiaceae bacterium]
MNRVLLVIGGLLVGVLALLFVAPAVVDWNRYRGVFEEEATRFLGREVRVGGEISLRLLPTPYVDIQKVRIADTAANVGKPLFMAENLTASLTVGGLLAGIIEAKDIKLTRPVATLVLDSSGGGSWSGLAPSNLPPALSRTPIAFDAIRIENGKLQILAPSGETRAVFDNINGDVSASSLAGPYRIAVTYATAGGKPRELRLSTAAPDPDGSIRTKGTVRTPDSDLSYTLDGQLHDIFAKTRFDGDLTARLPLPSSSDAPAPTSRDDGHNRQFDVRAKVHADTVGMQLTGLSLTFEQGGRPQLATGEAKATWANATSIDLNLSSHWLDLDRITGGAGAETSPLRKIQVLANGLSRALTTEGRTVARLSIDQATLGKEVVSGLAATLEQTGDKLQVRGLTASFPGGARLTADGKFEMAGKTPKYDGQINVRGASLTRFLGWAAPGRNLALSKGDSTFSLRGNVSIASDEIAGRNISLRIGRNALTGQGSWHEGANRQLKLDLEGSELDLSALVPDKVVTLPGIAERLAQASKPSSDGAKEANAGAQGGLNADIKLRLGDLRVANAVFHDSSADFELLDGHLAIKRIHLKSHSGYRLDLSGDIANLGRDDAKGQLTTFVSADSESGLEAAVQILAVPPDLATEVLTPERKPLMLPLRMAGRMLLGSRGIHARDLSLDGAAGSTRVSGTVKLRGQPTSWREKQTDIALTFEGPSAIRLLAGAAPRHAAGKTSGQPSPGPGAPAPSQAVIILR